LQDLKKDKEIKEIFKNIKTKKKISKGDIIYGRVFALKDKMAIVSIDHTEDNVVISPNDTGVLFIKDISKDYIKDIKECYRLGDIIKAKVIEVTDYEYKLSTKDDNLGVIRGFCRKCNKELSHTNSQNKVICTNCNTIQTKKFAK
jgi:exosome complex RNA-binding protein Csl4